MYLDSVCTSIHKQIKSHEPTWPLTIGRTRIQEDIYQLVANTELFPILAERRFGKIKMRLWKSWYRIDVIDTDTATIVLTRTLSQSIVLFKSIFKIRTSIALTHIYCCIPPVALIWFNIYNTHIRQKHCNSLAHSISFSFSCCQTNSTLAEHQQTSAIEIVEWLSAEYLQSFCSINECFSLLLHTFWFIHYEIWIFLLMFEALNVNNHHWSIEQESRVIDCMQALTRTSMHTVNDNAISIRCIHAIIFLLIQN